MDSGTVPFKKWSTDLVQSIHDAYPELENVFYAELGNHFMNTEGNICMAIAEWALKKDMPILTIHDSFICATQNKQNLEKTTRLCFSEATGAACILRW